MQRESIAFDIPAPFSLKATVLANGWHECAPMSWSEGGRCLQIIERNRRSVYRVSVVESRRTRWKVTLAGTVEGPSLDTALLARFVNRMRFVLRADEDYSEFHAMCEDHPTLHVLPGIGAGRTLRSASMTENIIKMICSTNVNWVQAVKMINRIAQLGPPLPHFAELTGWPTPREVLRAGETYLREACRLGYRVESILSFCRDVCEGRLDPETLIDAVAGENVATAELLVRLRTIRGVGPTSAHYLLSFLERHDRLAIDSSTVAHVARTHLEGRRPTRRQIERIYEPYGRWKNLVWWFEHWLTWDTAKTLLREAGLHARAGARGLS